MRQSIIRPPHRHVPKSRRNARSARRRANRRPAIIGAAKTTLMYVCNTLICTLQIFHCCWLGSNWFQIDEMTRTVNHIDGHFQDSHSRMTHTATHSTHHLSVRTLLAIQHKHLNPSYEMKRMFGSKVIQNEQWVTFNISQTNKQKSSSFKPWPFCHRNKRRNMRGARPLKATWLVMPKENWPPVTKTGIFMSLDHTNDNQAENSRKPKGVQWFVFEHSQSYRTLQQSFLNAVESMDSDNIIRIINQLPYHVDSLIQLSELCKMSEDHAMASELIEHAILALESAFHTLFSLTTGNSRLDYRRQENRAMFVVLFKHAQYLEGRACSRTALEIAKLIMSFDPDTDPLAMILIVDYYALRAKQYEWLVQLYTEWESTNNLSQLPNMAYSWALALFYLNKDSGDLTAADDAIQYAVLMFPAVIKLLLDELSIQADSRANTHRYVGAQAYERYETHTTTIVPYECRSEWFCFLFAFVTVKRHRCNSSPRCMSAARRLCGATPKSCRGWREMSTKFWTKSMQRMKSWPSSVWSEAKGSYPANISQPQF